MKCPRCQQESPADADFCPECGAMLAVVCGGCGTTNAPTHKFCKECGQGLGADTSPGHPQGRFTSPQSYTPRHLAEKILTSRSAVEGERKLVTVLFCDIANSTALAERLGADAMHGLLNRFFELALGEVHRYEGTINQFLGDGFMALFGAPLTFEDHARRAVLAALDIQRAIRSLCEERGVAGAGDLAVRMGLNTGPVVVGKIGDNLRMDYTAVGDTTNLAARLEHLAEPGSIYLSEQTYELVRSVAECRPLGARSVKGKTEPVMVYEAVAVSARPQPGGGDGRGIGTKLVGRAADAAALTAAVERLEGAEGGIIAIIGEAGLGKSRLVTEVRRLVGDANIRWLEGRGLSFGQTLSYWPFLDILKSTCGITEEDGPAESWTKLEALVIGLFPDAAEEILPYLASMLGLAVPGELEARVKHLDAQAMGRQILLTSRRFFERLARRRPLVLVFEDLHWVDQSSTELIEHLFPLVERVPLLLCGVSRPGAGTPAARLGEIARQSYGTRFNEVVLEPLSAAESGTLLQGLLGPPDVSAPLRELVLARAEGNPLFMEELIRSLIALKVLARDEMSGAWRTLGAVEEARIPDTIQGVIMARVDRLDDNVKEVLKLASVIGRSFFYRVLHALGENERKLDECLVELQDLELIRERRCLPELEYIFKHALVQEATYASILVDRRRQLHRRVAECVETLFGSRLEEFYGLLAHHYAVAEVWAKAQDYLFKAGDQAGRVAADTEALAHYRRAEEAYGRAFGDRWDPFQRAALERKIGEALFRRGEHKQALEYLDRALAHLGVKYPTSRSTLRLAILRQTLLQCGHRLAATVFVRTGAAQRDGAAEERVGIYKAMAWINYFDDQERFIYDCLALLNGSEQTRSEVGIVMGTSGVGVILDLMGLFGFARRYHDRAVALTKGLEDAVAIGQAHHMLGYHELLVGEWNEASNSLNRAAEAYRGAGALREWGAVQDLIGSGLSTNRGEFNATLERSRELVRVGQDGGDSQTLAYGLMMRATAERCLGRFDASESSSRAVMEICRSIPDYSALAHAGGNLGLCHLRRGDLTAAIAVLEETTRLIDDRGVKGYAITLARNALGEAYLVEAEQARGPARAGALKKAKRACRAAWKQGRCFRGGLPSAMRSQGTWAWLKGKHDSARRWWERSGTVAKELGARYETAMTWLEMGQRLDERELLERATQVFGEIGAEFDLATARARLAADHGGRLSTKPT
jgi:class 3 adenylate cyclase/tetratricopeptide (TPR) repeat protein